MKKLLMLLLAGGLCAGAAAQNNTGAAGQPSCQAQFDAINRSYDEQIRSFSDNPKINPIDREYRSLMLNFFRGQKLSAAESACGSTRKQYRSCLDQANAINQSYNSQVAALRGNNHYSKQERAEKVEQINQERNGKLKELLTTCGG
ncbi:hypothetical protein [Flaviaesturariibacter terrae]